MYRKLYIVREEEKERGKKAKGKIFIENIRKYIFLLSYQLFSVIGSTYDLK